MSPVQMLLMPPAMVAGAIACYQLLRRPILTIGIILGGTVLFDQFLMGPQSLLYRPEFYDNLNKTLGIGGLVINPVEILLFLLALGWMTRAVAGRLPGRPLLAVSWLGLAWAGAVLFSVWWGLYNGGNVKIGLWILRPVIYFLAIAFFTYQLVRTPRQVTWLLWILLAGVAVKSVATIWLWQRHHNDARGYECYVSHEDTSFSLYVLWVALAAFFLCPRQRSWRFLFWLVPLILLAVVFNDRRIAFFTLPLGALLIAVALPWRTLALRGLWLAAATVGLLLYVAMAAAGPENAATRPVKGVITGLQAEAKGENTDSSSQFRKLERYDLNYTIRAFPELGTGLGVKYLQPIKLPSLTFEYMVYIPHNQVLMTHALMGPHSYFILLFFYMALFGQLLAYHCHLREPWHRCLALAAAATVANWLIVGYYDMQLFFFRNSLFVGVVVALPACLMRWQEESEALNRAPQPPLPVLTGPTC